MRAKIVSPIVQVEILNYYSFIYLFLTTFPGEGQIPVPTEGFPDVPKPIERFKSHQWLVGLPHGLCLVGMLDTPPWEPTRGCPCKLTPELTPCSV